MPNSYTQNYQLNQWAADDQVSRLDFNADNAKIDAAIRAVDAKADSKATQTALAALQTVMSTKAEIVLGTYDGDGAASRSISLGFTPKAVLLFDHQGDPAYMGICYGGLAFQGFPVTSNYNNGMALEIVENGFKVYFHNENRVFTNQERRRYYYLILR